MKRIFILDTTLRDGAQTSSVSFTIADKIEVFSMLEAFGMDFIEAGWPGANDIDTQTFDKIQSPLKTAFCMTAKVGIKPQEDKNLQHIISVADTITMVGKSSEFHTIHAIGVKLEDNLNAIFSSIQFCVSNGKKVIFDAEHFFDGFQENYEYSLKCIEFAINAGAEFITLCDTNGGTLPNAISNAVTLCVKKFPNTKFGIHTHNDCELAVANTIAAVQSGCVMVQGTLNGLGERCGNASLTSILPILTIKLGYDCGKINQNISKILSISNKLSDILNEHHNPHIPFVGSSAFAHKGGLHASAVLKNPKLYEHIMPESVGNTRKVLISNQSGRANIISMLEDVGLQIYTDSDVKHIASELKKKVVDGYNFEGADASFYIFAHSIITKKNTELYTVLAYKANVERRFNAQGDLKTFSEGIVKLKFKDGQTRMNIAEGHGPVDAIYNAMREILITVHPQIIKLKLHDYKVRIIDSNMGTGAKTLVTIEFLQGESNVFSTIGVSDNIIDASFQALNDGIKYLELKK